MHQTTRTTAEQYPDLLRERTGVYFEQHGLCFAPLLETTPHGGCVLALYFQNRYDRRAVGRVQVLPPRRRLRLKRHDLPARLIDIECPGGAFGVVRLAFPIPAKHQGSDITFDIAADVLYPDGRGRMLRLRAGVPAGSLGGSIMHAHSSPARVMLALPRGLAQPPRRRADAEAEIIWSPDLLEDTQRRAAA
ncbi:MAG TPA: hypothetical protein VGR35_21025 [Tepidisphaeraceae bacterium]|nr:hypothetical protein [Tepidisphaeraceae bacterium]